MTKYTTTLTLQEIFIARTKIAELIHPIRTLNKHFTTSLVNFVGLLQLHKKNKRFCEATNFTITSNNMFHTQPSYTTFLVL